MPDERKPVWKTCLLAGCGVALLLAIVAGVVVAMNWGSISKYASETSEAFQGLMAVRTEVQRHTGTAEVGVVVESTTGVEGRTLKIEVGDLGFLGGLEPSSAGARQKALEIAAVARDAAPAGTEFERYKIVFTSRVSVGVTLTKSQTWVFEASELPPPAPR